MEDKPVSPEPSQAPEIKDTPEHMFVKASLSRTSFLNPETNDRTTLKDRMGKIFPQFEAQVVAEFDRLKTLGENRIASKYEDDARRRARIVYLEWQYEQRMAGKYDIGVDEIEKLAQEDFDINNPVDNPDAPQDEKTYVRTPPRPDGFIKEDNYSDESHP